ncbi:hypothetical protein JXA80_01055 [bacterium]|nr:hypothetical protein [candidate division CSSED10-310 bacterium]
MTYRLLDSPTDAEAVFRERPNQFLGRVAIVSDWIGNRPAFEADAHPHDSGRIAALDDGDLQ